MPRVDELLRCLDETIICERMLDLRLQLKYSVVRVVLYYEVGRDGVGWRFDSYITLHIRKRCASLERLSR